MKLKLSTLLYNRRSHASIHQQRSQVFTSITWVVVVMCLISAIQHYFFLQDKILMPALSLSLAGLYLLNYYLLAYHHNYKLSYSIAILATFATVHFGMYYSGGLLNPGLAYFATVILAAFFLLSYRFGTLIMFLSIGDICYFYFARNNTRPSLLAGADMPITFFVTFIFLIVSITLFAFALEKSKNKALLELERKNYEMEKASRELQKLSLAVSQTDNAIIITDRNARIEWVNAGFEKLSGYRLADVIGTRGELLRKGDPTGFSNENKMYRQCIDQKKAVKYVNKNISKSGKEYWVVTTLTPVYNEQGELTNLIAIDADITERKQMEEELVKAMDIAQESVANQREFINHVSREIQSPLTGMIQMSEELSDSNLKDEQRSLVETIRMSARTLDLTLNDILDLAKIKSREINFNKPRKKTPSS